MLKDKMRMRLKTMQKVGNVNLGSLILTQTHTRCNANTNNNNKNNSNTNVMDFYMYAKDIHLHISQYRIPTPFSCQKQCKPPPYPPFLPFIVEIHSS